MKKAILSWRNKFDLKLLAKRAPDCPPIVFDLSEAVRPREKVSEFLIESIEKYPDGGRLISSF